MHGRRFISITFGLFCLEIKKKQNLYKRHYNLNDFKILQSHSYFLETQSTKDIFQICFYKMICHLFPKHF